MKLVMWHSTKFRCVFRARPQAVWWLHFCNYSNIRVTVFLPTASRQMLSAVGVILSLFSWLRPFPSSLKGSTFCLRLQNYEKFLNSQGLVSKKNMIIRNYGAQLWRRNYGAGKNFRGKAIRIYNR